MQNKSISNIKADFEPLHIPIVKGRFALRELRDDSFPVYVTSVKRGVDIIIREGTPLLTTFPYSIENKHFYTKFSTVLELSRKRGFTVHAIVINDFLTEEEILKKLNTYGELLSPSTQLYITMVIYERSVDEMLFKNITELVKAFFGTKASPFIPNTIPAFYTEVRGKANLIELTDFLLSEVTNTNGVMLLHKYGFYTQGSQSINNTEAVILNPTEDVYGIVTDINVSTKFLPGETLEMADEILIKFGETEYKVDISKRSLAFRGIIKDLQEQLIGSKVLCENLYLPSTNTMKIKQLKKFIF